MSQHNQTSATGGRVSVEETRKALAAATWLLRKASRRYQGDLINRASLLDARATYRAAWKAVRS